VAHRQVGVRADAGACIREDKQEVWVAVDAEGIWAAGYMGESMGEAASCSGLQIVHATRVGCMLDSRKADGASMIPPSMEKDHPVRTPRQWVAGKQRTRRMYTAVGTSYVHVGEWCGAAVRLQFTPLVCRGGWQSGWMAIRPLQLFNNVLAQHLFCGSGYARRSNQKGRGWCRNQPIR